MGGHAGRASASARGFIISAGVICRRIRQSLDTLLLAVGICWALIALGLEVIRHDLATAAVVIHGISLLVLLSLWIPGRKIAVADQMPVIFAVAAVGTGVWAAIDAPTPVAWVLLFVAPLALIAWRLPGRGGDTSGVRRRERQSTSSDRSLAAVLAAAMAGVWALQRRRAHGLRDSLLPARVCRWCGRCWRSRSAGSSRRVRGNWASDTANALGIGFAVLLAFSTVAIITRDASAHCDGADLCRGTCLHALHPPC